MTRYRHALIAAAIVCWLAGLTVLSLYFGWFTWAATPQGKATLAGVMFVALATWLTCVAIRDARRKRAAREAQEWDDLDEWERQMYAEMSPWLDRDDLPVRPVTRADMDEADRRLTRSKVELNAWGERLDRPRMYQVDREADALQADALQAEAYADALPTAVAEWPQPQSPRLTDYAVAPPAPAPLPMRYYLGEAKPMAEVESLTGAAAWFTNDMRTGVDVSDNILDAIVPVSGGPRHAWGSNRGTDTQRADPAFVAWEENTGAWPIVRELVGAGAP